MSTLTPAQERYLAEIRQAGRKVYNGRALRPLAALEAAGLIHLERDMVAHAKGGGIELSHRLTATPA